MSRRVREVMKSDPITFDTEASIRDVAKTMRDRDIGAVLVTQNGNLQGIVTDRDIVIRALAEGRTEAKVGEIASAKEIVSVKPDDDVDTARDCMRDKAVRRIPVVENGKAIGILSIGDLAIEKEPRSVLGQLSAAPPNN